MISVASPTSLQSSLLVKRRFKKPVISVGRHELTDPDTSFQSDDWTKVSDNDTAWTEVK